MPRDAGYSERLFEELFTADVVLPDQFYPDANGLRTASGERALMWAVFTDGIESYRRTANSPAKHDVEEFLETEAWLTATDWNSVFSFANLCEVFGFAPEPLRQALLGWKSSRSNPGQRQRFRPATLRAA